MCQELLAAALDCPDVRESLWLELEGAYLDIVRRLHAEDVFVFESSLTAADLILERREESVDSDSPEAALVLLQHPVPVGDCWLRTRLHRAQAEEVFETLEILWADVPLAGDGGHRAGGPSVRTAVPRLVAPVALPLGTQPADGRIPWIVLVRGGVEAPECQVPDFVSDVRVRRTLGHGRERRWLITGLARAPGPGAKRFGELTIEGAAIPISLESAHQFHCTVDSLTCSATDGVWLAAADLEWQGGGPMVLPIASLEGFGAGFDGGVSTLRNGPERMRVLIRIRDPGSRSGAHVRPSLVLRVPGEEDAMVIAIRGSDW